MPEKFVVGVGRL